MTFLVSFGIFLLFIIFMSIGVIIANKPIKGSCGGLQKTQFADKCPVCGKDAEDQEKCTEIDKKT